MSGIRASRPIVSNVALAVPSAVLTLTANAGEGETVTIGDTVYTFTATVTDPYHVLIGAAATNSIDNLILAITAGAGAGTNYGTGTVAHPDVTAAAGAGDTMDVTPLNTNGTVPADNIALAEGITGTWNRTSMAAGAYYAFEIPLLSHAGGVAMQICWHDATSAFTGSYGTTNYDDERAPVDLTDASKWSAESGVTIPTVTASAKGSNMVHLNGVNAQRSRLRIIPTAATQFSLLVHQKES